MDMIDRYLNAVAAQLPQDERADIVAELRDLILSRFEAKEEELGRPLTENEQEAILREIGHPLVVAARYRKGPDSLVGPELFPYWLFGVKAGLMVLLAVYALTLFIRLISGVDDAGQAIAQAFHGFFGAGLTLIGAATLAAAIFEHQGIRPAWLTKWRVKDLGAFGLADPAAWGASISGGETAKAAWTPTRRSKAWPGGEYLFSFLAVGMFVLWWIGVLHFPGLMSIQLRGQDAAVSGAPVWSILFGPILLYAFAQMAVDLASLVRPGAFRARAAAQIVLAAGGLWLTWAIFEAGHWFTLTRGEETARIEGDWSMLNFHTLGTLGDGGRDLQAVAATLSVVAIWVLAFSAISLAFKVVVNLWRLARG
ncbi:MAG: HAAS signaling domain-containing protein [Brevundimonas sp.]